MDLIISDIHADISAINRIIELTSSIDFKKRYGKFSRIINLGDVLERGSHPKQVLKKMMVLSQKYPLISVMGNHDEAFLYGRRVSGNSWESLSAHDSLIEEDLEFFKKNQDDTYGQQEFLDRKTGIVCVHGGPLDPKKITPKDANLEAWFYQKSWQRLSETEEFFSPYGYHYTASSAFLETKTNVKNPIILCGHQHIETAIKQNKDEIKEILSITKLETEKLSKFIVEKKEILIKSDNSYLIRVGLGGPEGYYGTEEAMTHFGIIQDDPKKVILFGIKSRM
ncbi:MAG: metallophosphoesterase [Nitrosopumilus sp.]|nr:metallophosphoesterase [Nitrosopumilus sp.]